MSVIDKAQIDFNRFAFEFPIAFDFYLCHNDFMDSQLLDKVKNLNRISLVFGILSVAMPILLISLPLLFRIIQSEENYFSFLIQTINIMQLIGITFGIIGYFISRHSLNLLKYEKASDELMSKTQASRTWNIIGIVIFLAIFCGSLNQGIAF